MQKLLFSYFSLLLIVSLTSSGSVYSEELSYAMAKCQVSVYKLDRLDDTYKGDDLKFQKVLYHGNEVLLMKPNWTGVNSHFTPFIKVFTYRYANAQGLDIDVTIESYCNEIPKEHLLKLFKKQRFLYTLSVAPNCYMLDMRDSGTGFSRYRYGMICLSKRNMMFIHLTPKALEEGDNKVVAAKDEKEKIEEDLKRLAAFYNPLLNKYIPKKFTMDLTSMSDKYTGSTSKSQKK